MTAHRPTRSRSDNSVPEAREQGPATAAPDRDPRLQTIVQYAHRRNGVTTDRVLASRCGWSRAETTAHLNDLHQGNYVQLEELRDATIVLLTERGEQLARETSR